MVAFKHLHGPPLTLQLNKGVSLTLTKTSNNRRSISVAYVRKSKTVLDPGTHAMDSGFQEPHVHT